VVVGWIGRSSATRADLILLQQSMVAAGSPCTRAGQAASVLGCYAYHAVLCSLGVLPSGGFSTWSASGAVAEGKDSVEFGLLWARNCRPGLLGVSWALLR